MRAVGELELVTIGYVMARLGISRTRAYQITTRSTGDHAFPEPVGTLHQERTKSGTRPTHARVWNRVEVDEWLRRNRPDALPADDAE